MDRPALSPVGRSLCFVFVRKAILIEHVNVAPSAGVELNSRRPFPRRSVSAHIAASSSGAPARALISLLMLCATLNDSATEEVSSSPSPQVAVTIAL